MGRPGLTRVDHSETAGAPPAGSAVTRTMPTSVIASRSAAVPVVSRSTKAREGANRFMGSAFSRGGLGNIILDVPTNPAYSESIQGETDGRLDPFRRLLPQRGSSLQICRSSRLAERSGLPALRRRRAQYPD